MTALITSNTARVTGVDRMLLATAAAIDRYVAARLSRRGSARTPSSATTASRDVRSNAVAMGWMGILPR